MKAVSQGQSLGRWSRTFRALLAILAGILISFRRMVPVLAFANPLPAMAAAARVRLKAITASTSQAAFAVKTPEGRCARALSFRSALTCSMTA